MFGGIVGFFRSTGFCLEGLQSLFFQWGNYGFLGVRLKGFFRSTRFCLEKLKVCFFSRGIIGFYMEDFF